MSVTVTRSCPRWYDSNVDGGSPIVKTPFFVRLRVPVSPIVWPLILTTKYGCPLWICVFAWISTSKSETYPLPFSSTLFIICKFPDTDDDIDVDVWVGAGVGVGDGVGVGVAVSVAVGVGVGVGVDVSVAVDVGVGDDDEDDSSVSGTVVVASAGDDEVSVVWDAPAPDSDPPSSPLDERPGRTGIPTVIITPIKRKRIPAATSAT